MNKPNGYDDVRAGGEYIPIELGGHTATIKRVKETTSKAGKPMIQVAIDFDRLDVQPDYFMHSFQQDTREDKKWPYQGTQYILTEDDKGKCSRSFKSFITCVEHSNDALCEWGDNFEKWFPNKKIGVVYGENEEEYDGEIRTRRRIRYFCAYDKAKEQKVPDKRFLEKPISANTATTTSPFMQLPEGVEEEIPF